MLQVLVGVRGVAVDDGDAGGGALHRVAQQVVERELRVHFHAVLLATSEAMASTEPKFSSSNSSSSTMMSNLSSRKVTSSTVCSDVRTPFSLIGSSGGTSRSPVTLSLSHPCISAAAFSVLTSIQIPPVYYLTQKLASPSPVVYDQLAGSRAT